MTDLKFYSIFEKLNITPRSEQKSVIDTLIREWNNYKYFIIDAPTGVGKSYIGYSVSDVSKGSYVLTSTIQLQDQYQKMSAEFVDIKGRSNYKCALNPMLTAENAPCTVMPVIASGCRSNGNCPYLNRRDQAANADITVANYSYFMTAIASSICDETSEVTVWKRRETIICDEAHNLEQILVNTAEVEIDVASLYEKFGIGHTTWRVTDDLDMNLSLLDSIFEALATKLVYYKQRLQDEFPEVSKGSAALVANMKKAQIEKIQRIQTKINQMTNIFNPIKLYFDTCNDAQWLVHPKTDENKLILTPLRANFLFKNIFAPLADKIILMSATIGDPNVYCDELGISKDEVCYISVGTSFPPENSPIILIPKLKLGNKDIEKSFDLMTEMVSAIMDNHNEEAGIIHSGTYRIQNELLKRLDKKYVDRIISRTTYGGSKADDQAAPKSTFEKLMDKSDQRVVKNADLIKMHQESYGNNTVLMSPSLHEGTDLHDDLSRFQVIIKLPWASLGDPRVSAKSMISDAWYANRMWTTILQASGRSVRHHDDFAVTYILDGSFPYFYKQWQQKLPSWFKNKIVS